MILIQGGRIVTPEGISSSDILIGGLFILPGAIDPHVHFRDPENTSKEDFSTGTASALAGGVTTIIDMPNYRNPPTTTIAAYNEKRLIAASKARCDYQLRFGASESNFQEAAGSGAPSLKIFLSDTKSDLQCSREAAVMHFKAFPKGKPVCVHAEDRDRIEKRVGKFRSQSQVQDKLVSQIACEFSLREAGRLGRRVHICHLPTGLEIELCRRYKNATYEVTPNHLFMSTDDIKRLGPLGKINPPLRDRREQAALWRNLNDDTIIASDHAPHLISHKLEGSPGFPGVGTLLPLMLDAVNEKRLKLESVARMCSFNPASAFLLHAKGSLAPGFDADIVLADMKKKWRITAENRLSKCAWTPFEGREIKGRIEKVLLRGNLAYDSEGVISKPGKGRELL